MPNQTIDLTSYDPQAAAIQRQRQLADLLQQQAMEPVQAASPNAPISPLSGIAKILKGYYARKDSEKADTDYAALQTSRQKGLADMLSRQYQVPESSGTVTNQPNTQTGVSGITAPTISGVSEARPTTPQEQLANSLSMMSSNNPQAAQMAPALYQEAQQKQQASQLLSGLDMASVPERARPIIQAQIANGDVAGAMKTYGDATKPVTVGDSIQQPTATGYTPAYQGQPTGIREYLYAKQNDGFKGTYSQWLANKAEQTHITVNGAAPTPMNAEDKASIGAQIATGMPLNQVIPGFGKQAVAARAEGRQAAIKSIMAENPGMTAADAGVELANRSIAYQGGKKSIGQLTTMLGATKQAVSQLDFNVDKVTQEMAKLGSTNSSPILNAIARGEQKWTGNPAYSSLFFYMHAAAMESARILQGGQASIAQLHAGAAEQAKQWANVNMTPASWKAVAESMKAEGQNRVENYSTAIDDMKFGKHTPPAKPQTPPAAAAHPQDQAAISWARANPKDPRSAAILSANGVK